jgi:hypothetical protein
MLWLRLYHIHPIQKTIIINFLFCLAFEQDQGISVLTDAVKACTAEIEKYKGKLVVKEPPRAVSCFQHLLFLFIFPPQAC